VIEIQPEVLRYHVAQASMAARGISRFYSERQGVRWLVWVVTADVTGRVLCTCETEGDANEIAAALNAWTP
jgi:hypothetical protein